jgi:hypothetical protein
VTAHLNSATKNSRPIVRATGIKNYNIGVGPLKRLIQNISPIFHIGRLNTADINTRLLVLGDKSINIDIGYCYQSTPIINFRHYNKLFFY